MFRGQDRFSRNVIALRNIAEERRSQQIIVLLSNWLDNSKEHAHISDANNSSDTAEMPCILWKSEVLLP